MGSNRIDLSGILDLGSDETVVQFGDVKRPEVDYLVNVEKTGKMGDPDMFFDCLGKYNGMDLNDRAVKKLNMSEISTDILIRGCVEYNPYYGGNPFGRELEHRDLAFEQMVTLRDKGQVSRSFQGWLHAQCSNALIGKKMDYHTYNRFFIRKDLSEVWFRQILNVDPDTAYTIVTETMEYKGGRYDNEYTVPDYPFQRFIMTGNLDILQAWAEKRLTSAMLEGRPINRMRNDHYCGWTRPIIRNFMNGDRSQPVAHVIQAATHIMDNKLREKAVDLIDVGDLSLVDLAYAAMCKDLPRTFKEDVKEELRRRCSPDDRFGSALFRFLYPRDKDIERYHEEGNRSIYWELDEAEREGVSITKDVASPVAFIEGLKESYRFRS